MSTFPCWYVYTGDLKKEPGWRLCTWQAQNLWLRILVELHDMPHRGRFLMRDGLTPLTNAMIAKLLEMPMAEYEDLAKQLLDTGVAEIIDGAMANRRMVRESEAHDKKVQAGKKGAAAKWHNDSTLPWQNDGTEQPESAPYLSYSHKNLNQNPNQNKNKIQECSPEQLAEDFNKIPGIKPVLLRDGKLPNTIRTKVLARLKSYPTALFWSGFFITIKNSNFLTGKIITAGRDPFHASFDWIMGPQNFDKIISGAYANVVDIPIRKLVT